MTMDEVIEGRCDCGGLHWTYQGNPGILTICNCGWRACGTVLQEKPASFAYALISAGVLSPLMKYSSKFECFGFVSL